MCIHAEMPSTSLISSRETNQINSKIKDQTSQLLCWSQEITTNLLFRLMKDREFFRAVVTSEQESTILYPRVRFPNSCLLFTSSTACTSIRDWTSLALLNLWEEKHITHTSTWLLLSVCWGVAYEATPTRIKKNNITCHRSLCHCHQLWV